jgi:hypothetical protein
MPTSLTGRYAKNISEIAHSYARTARARLGIEFEPSTRRLPPGNVRALA